MTWFAIGLIGGRRSWLSTMLLVLAVAPVHSQTWTWTSALTLRETLTNNVDLVPTSMRESDLVTEIMPSLGFTERGRRTNLTGYVLLPVVLYARTGSANNTVYPSAYVIGDVALVERLLFVEGSINISQQFFNPFGSQPTSITSPSQNRYQSETYRISPYIKGSTQANTNYLLRYSTEWTNLSGAPVSTNNAQYTYVDALASNTQSQLGWRASYRYTNTDFNNQRPIETQILRMSAVYSIDPQVQLIATGGYEDNKFLVTSSNGPIYGVGFAWRPTPRTQVAGDWEHRFFGNSYNFSFDHRTALTAWNISASRNISTYPQQIAGLPAGVNVSGFLNNLFATTIPDPVARQQFIDQFILDRGLPTTLTAPVNLYSEQVLLQDTANAMVGFTGARNNLMFSVFYLKSTPITASGTPIPIVSANNNTQAGGSVVWTNQLTPSVSLTAAMQINRTTNNTGQQGSTTQGGARIGLSRPLSAKTSVFTGVRYQRYLSDFAPGYNETGVFAGISHTFR